MAVLIYDVSRWGDSKMWTRAPIMSTHVVKPGLRSPTVLSLSQMMARPSPLATLIKGLKRAMAAEYSRELSAKVFKAQCRLTAAGFKQGGSAGYGLWRQSLSRWSNPTFTTNWGTEEPAY